MLDLSTKYLGLALKNPLVPSSSPLSRSIDAVLNLEDAGAAAIVMHSLFEEDVRNDALMIDRFLVNPDAFGEAAGHLPFGRDYQSKLDGYLEQIQQLKSRLSIPVVASLNGSSLTGWVELGNEMQAAGADALELNAWFMPGDPKICGVKMLLAGADAVHMASAVLQRGPQVLKEVLAGIERWMEGREYESVAQLKGSMSQQNLPDPSAFARAAYLNALNSFTPPPGMRY